MEILKEILKKIKPTIEEENLIEEKIKKFIERIKVKDALVVLGGSGAKGTFLKSTNDADIFVQFDYDKYKDKSNEISNILEKQLKKTFKKLIRLHGSRDYFQVKEEKFMYEIIPIIEIRKSINSLNITDVSPLHAKFVKKNTNKKLIDEIRLLKQFCKANNIYGAESYIKGFSGYICELLIIYYGSFQKLIKASSKWKEKTVIDIKKFYLGKDIFLEMNKSKTLSPIIIVDPVQKDRNAASSLSIEKFNMFKKKSIEFLKKPSLKFFKEKYFNVGNLKKENIVLEIVSLSGKEDVVGAKLLKAFNFIHRGVLKEDFKIKNYGWNWDREKYAFFYFKIPKNIDKIKVVRGPAIKFTEHVKNFKKKYKKVFIKRGRVYAKAKRKYVNPKEFIKNIIKHKYVKERVKSIKLT